MTTLNARSNFAVLGFSMLLVAALLVISIPSSRAQEAGSSTPAVVAGDASSTPTADATVTTAVSDSTTTPSTDATVVTGTTSTTTVISTDTSTTTPTPSDASTTSAPSTSTSDQPAVVVAAPVLSTDKTDYLAGDNATIFGNFFQPLQAFVLKIFGVSFHGDTQVGTTVTVSSDPQGSFNFSYTLPDVFVPTYNVIASDLFGNVLAQTSFNDSAVVDFSQCSNNAAPSTATNCPGGWINGILNSSNSHYHEDDVTPQRLVIGVSGSPTVHTFTIHYQARKGSIHAYDSLATWNYTQSTADPFQGLATSDVTAIGTANTAFLIPLDPTPIPPAGTSISTLTSAHELPDANRQMVMYGGTITGITVPSHDSPLSGEDYASTTITFTVPDPTAREVMFLFGGHDAASAGPRGWGAGLGSGSISGGPYHFKLIAVDGSSVGNRDNQIQGGAIISLNTPTISTALSPASPVTVGTAVHDTATLSGATGTAGGAVNYKVFTNNTCSVLNGSQPSPATVTVTNAIVPNSGSVTFNSTGTFYWQAVYSGDTNNTAATSTCISETLVVNQATPTLTTTATAGPVTIGSNITDTAHLSGGVSPTGSITFNVYAPGDTTCTTPTSVSPSQTVSGNGDYTSGNFTTGTVGTYRWRAFYSGDANNSAVSTACNDANESSAVSKASPTISTIPSAGGVIGTVLNDTATLSGGSSPTGSVTFTLYPPSDASCSGAASYTDTDPTSPYATSPGFTSNAVGTWHWKAHYAGDSNNNPADSLCADEAVIVSKASPTLATTIHDASHVATTSVAAGSTVHDSATISGGSSPTGTVDFAFYTDGACSAGATPAGTGIALVAGVAHPSSSEGPLAAGSYSFKAHYNGDSNNNTADSACEPLTVTKLDSSTVTEIHADSIHTATTTVALGSTVHDKATVSGSFGTPTGNVTINWFTNGSCNASPADSSSGNTLSGGTVDVTGFAKGPLTAGNYSFQAVYSGDTNYNGSTGACEPLTVNKAQLSIDTVIHDSTHAATTTVGLDSVVHDTATTTGQVDGIVPTGAVTFQFFSNGTCADTGSPVANTGVDGSSVRSADSAPLAAGAYSYQASVAGDANYNGATSACEPLTVNKATLGISTIIHDSTHAATTTVGLGAVVHDTATVTGGVGGFPIPAISFTFDGSPIATTSPEATFAATTVDTAPLAAGSHTFKASVASDDNYTGATSADEPLAVNKARLAITTQAHDVAHTDITNGSVAVGSVTHDTVMVIGGVDGFSTSTPTFTLTSNYTGSCASGDSVANGGIDSGNGANKSADSSPLATGVYAYRGSIAGNDNYISADSACEPFNVVDAHIVLSPLTATNNIDSPHTITATVDKNDGTGTTTASGVLVTFSLLNNTAGAVFVGGVNTCTTVAGTCSVTINSPTPGSVDIHATTTFSIGGVSLTRASGDGLSGDSANANKLYVAGGLEIVKNIVLNGYPFPTSVDRDFSFTVTGPSFPSGTTAIIHVVDGVPTGAADFPNIIPGSYTVTESDPGVAWAVTGNGGVAVVSANATSTQTVTNTVQQPHTTISITPNTFETLPGENVILTISDTNDGHVPLTNPSVDLGYNGATTTLTKALPPGAFTGGDTNNNGIMDVGETWTWTVSVSISANTVFSVAGHGTDPFGNDISPTNGFPTEGGVIAVKVIGTTRTLGFWQTHTDFTSKIAALGLPLYVGTTTHIKSVATTSPITTYAKGVLFGGFYAPIPKTTTGTKRGQTDQTRITLLQQLLAAKLNCAAFGCSSTVRGQIATADADYATGNVGGMKADIGLLDTFNGNGDAFAIPSSLPATGKATPKTSQGLADKAFWDLP